MDDDQVDQTDAARSAKGQRGAYAKGVQRRQEILDRALQVFSERGYDRTSLRSIGEAIGVTHAALLHYFPSKEALLVAVLRERDARSPSSGHRPFLEELVLGAEHNATVPGLIALYTSMAGTSADAGNDEARAYFSDRFTRIRSRVAAELRADGRFGEADSIKLASLMIAASDGLQMQWLLDPDVDIAGSLDLLQRILRIDTPAPG